MLMNVVLVYFVCSLKVVYCRRQFSVKGQMVNISDFAGHHGLCHLFFVFVCFPDPLKMYKTFLALGLYKVGPSLPTFFLPYDSNTIFPSSF